jgi:hypothetical protein
MAYLIKRLSYLALLLPNIVSAIVTALLTHKAPSLSQN